MSERPQRRLVTKGKFVRTLMDKTILFSVGGLLLPIGLLFMVVTLFVLLKAPNDLRIFGIGLVTGAVGFFALRSSWRLFKEGREIESVRPLTVHNQHQLPPEESLVRAAAAPPSQQPAELLRAVQQGVETPSEELLRASTTNERE